MPKINVPIAFPAAHIWTWAAGLFLAFWPYSYRGVQVTADGQRAETGAGSLLEVNGPAVLLLLAMPAIITAIAWVSARVPGRPTPTGVATLWLFAGVLTLFCLLSIMSIGLFYVPAALALWVGAFQVTRRRMHTTSAASAARERS